MLTGFRAKEYPRLPDQWAGSKERKKLNELNQVVLKACAPNPRKRYQTAEEMQEELELLKSGKSLLRLRRLEQSRRVLLTVLAGGLVGLGWIQYGLQVSRTRAAEQESRAVEEELLRQIAHAQLAGRRAGQITAAWSRLAELGKGGNPLGGVAGIATLLAGEEARLVSVFRSVSGSSAAFAPDVRAVVSGAGADCALLVDANGNGKSLPILGLGPVCWSTDGVPLQCAWTSNHLVLREAETGKVRRDSAPTAGSWPKALKMGSSWCSIFRKSGSVWRGWLNAGLSSTHDVPWLATAGVGREQRLRPGRWRRWWRLSLPGPGHWSKAR
jgi:hypothetical protein